MEVKWYKPYFQYIAERPRQKGNPQKWTTEKNLWVEVQLSGRGVWEWRGHSRGPGYHFFVETRIEAFRLHNAGHDYETSVPSRKIIHPMKLFAHPQETARSLCLAFAGFRGKNCFLTPVPSIKMLYSRKVDISVIQEHRRWEIYINQVC